MISRFRLNHQTSLAIRQTNISLSPLPLLSSPFSPSAASPLQAGHSANQAALLVSAGRPTARRISGSLAVSRAEASDTSPPTKKDTPGRRKHLQFKTFESKSA